MNLTFGLGIVIGVFATGVFEVIIAIISTVIYESEKKGDKHK